jgi:hypothetical protein
MLLADRLVHLGLNLGDGILQQREHRHVKVGAKRK